MNMRDAGRDDFVHFIEMPTRWMDNDIYGHVNNVNYYSYFDTAVNRFLIDQGVLNIQMDHIVGFVVDTGCSYFKSLTFPDVVHVGLRVEKIGSSSVRYALALFRNDEANPCAGGHFVHVYVDRRTGLSVPVPDDARTLFQSSMRAVASA